MSQYDAIPYTDVYQYGTLPRCLHVFKFNKQTQHHSFWKEVAYLTPNQCPYDLNSPY